MGTWVRHLLDFDTGSIDNDRRARTLMAILLYAIPMALVSTAYVWPEPNGPESGIFMLLAAAGFVGVIVLVRSGRLEIAVASFAVILWVVAFGQPLVTGDMSTNVVVVPLGAVMLIYVIGRRRVLWVGLWSVSAFGVLFLGTNDEDTIYVPRSLWIGSAVLATVLTIVVVLYGARQLANAVRDQAALADQLTARERVVARLEELAHTDPLTGFRNRRSLDETFAGLPAGSAVGLVDLDNFKRVNDDLSHMIGDEMLVRFSELVARSSQPCDHLYRIGGDEFLILRENATAPDLGAWLHEVRDHMHEQSWPQVSVDRRISFSSGVVNVGGQTLDQVLKRADRALYAAKEAGRDVIVVIDA